MTRSLTSGTEAAKDARAAEPHLVLKLEFGGAVGTRYYAATTILPVAAEPRLVNAGEIIALWKEGARPDEVRVELALADHDLALDDLRQTTDWEQKPAALYLYFAGLDAGDMMPLAKGVVGGPVVFDAAARLVRLTLVDAGWTFEKTLGHSATQEEFPKIERTHEGRLIPLVFGRVERVPALFARAGWRTELAEPLSPEAASFYVADASGFPAGAVRLRVGFEELTGSFSGNRFQVTARGAAIHSGTVTHFSPRPDRLRDSAGLAGKSNHELAARGGWLRLIVNNVTCFRRLLGHDAASRTLQFRPLPAKPQAGQSYQIATPPHAHHPGDAVTEVLADGYVYLANDAPSVAVDKVEVLARQRNAASRTEEILGCDKDGYVVVPRQYYTVNTNDTASFPDLGRAVTTVTFRRRPTDIPELRAASDELFVTLRGVEAAGDGTGELLENPALVLAEILTRWLGLTAGTDTNPESFADAEQKTSYLRFGFALPRVCRGLELAAELAFQARCRLLWNAGVATLDYLEGETQPAQAVISPADLYQQGAYRLERAPSPELFTQVSATFSEKNEPRRIVLRDQAAALCFGLRQRSLDLFAYQREAYARLIAAWWLARWSRPAEVLYLTTPLNKLQLERGDWVELHLGERYPQGQAAEVEGLVHDPGDAQRPDGITFALRLPTFAGCASSCEVACETGCESAAEFGPTHCASQCEISCEHAGEVFCTFACEVSCTSGAQIWCPKSMESGGGGPCDTSCESYVESWSCDSGVETGGETCALTCESAAETGEGGREGPLTAWPYCLPSDDPPAAVSDYTGAPGASVRYSRADHRHPLDTDYQWLRWENGVLSHVGPSSTEQTKSYQASEGYAVTEIIIELDEHGHVTGLTGNCGQPWL